MKKINRNLFDKYRFHLAVSFFVFIFVIFSRVPYINLFIVDFTGVFLWVTIIIWIGFKALYLIRLALISFVIVCLLVLSGEPVVAEHVGNAIFLTLLTGVILLIRDTLREE